MAKRYEFTMTMYIPDGVREGAQFVLDADQAAADAADMMRERTGQDVAFSRRTYQHDGPRGPRKARQAAE